MKKLSYVNGGWAEKKALHVKKACIWIFVTPWPQDVNWTYINQTRNYSGIRTSRHESQSCWWTMASSETFCKTFKRKRSLVKVNKFKKIKNFDWLWKNCFFLCTACMLMFFFRELCFGRFSKCPINWWRRMENKTDTRKVKIESKTTRYCV